MLRTPLLSALALTICCSAFAFRAPSRQLIVATNLSNSTGALSLVDTAQPWAATPLAATASQDSIVRVFDGHLYVLGRHDRKVEVRALPGLGLIQQFSIPEVLAPRDLALVGPTMVLISDHDSANLWWLDTTTGVVSAGQDLSAYADDDRLPDVSMMEVVGMRVYVQMQRYDRNHYTEHGAMLAVLAPGFNPNPPVILESVIELRGRRPDYRMQVNKAGDRLWISAAGIDNDWGGYDPTGIEEVDLNAGQTLGFLLTESQCGADLGPFVMVDDDKGFAIAHTSIVASTHLRVFQRNVGQLAELHVSINGRVDTIAFDEARRQVFYPIPDGWSLPGGVLVFDADTDQQLSPMTIGIGGNPFDMVVGG